jgi:hypothetical protein
MAKIIVDREHGGVGMMRSIIIEIDGKRCAKVRMNARVECEIPPGVLSIQARMDWVKSPPGRVHMLAPRVGKRLLVGSDGLATRHRSLTHSRSGDAPCSGARTGARASPAACRAIRRFRAAGSQATSAAINDPGAAAPQPHQAGVGRPTHRGQFGGGSVVRFREMRGKLPSLLGGYEPTILRTPIKTSAAPAWVRVRIEFDTRQAADALCSKLEAAGEHCLVQRNAER